MQTKELIIKQNVLGQEVLVNISLEKNNFEQSFSSYEENFSESEFQFLTSNFLNIVSGVNNLRYSKSTGGTLFCYGDGSQPHQFKFIFDEVLYCFYFGVSEAGRIIITKDGHNTRNLKSIFDNFLKQLHNYSDKDYYSYYSQKLDAIS